MSDKVQEAENTGATVKGICVLEAQRGFQALALILQLWHLVLHERSLKVQQNMVKKETAQMKIVGE